MVPADQLCSHSQVDLARVLVALKIVLEGLVFLRESWGVTRPRPLDDVEVVVEFFKHFDFEALASGSLGARPNWKISCRLGLNETGVKANFFSQCCE